MLKYNVLLLLALAVCVKSGDAYRTTPELRTTMEPSTTPNPGSGEEDEELTVEEFHDELKALHDNALGFSDDVEAVEELAREALDDSGKWDEVEEQYEALVEDVGEGFTNEAIRMLHLVVRFWKGPGDFQHEPYCDAVYNLMQTHEQSLDLEDNLAYAFISDISCFKSALRKARMIPFDEMIPEVYSERQAMELIAAIFMEMHVMKESAIRFHESLQFLHDQVHMHERRSEKKEVRALMSILKRYIDRKQA